MPRVEPADVMNGLISRGFSPVAAAGITGNLAHESNLDTSIKEINPMTESARKQGGGFGLAQWTGKRHQDLQDFANKSQRPIDDVDTQLDFLSHELTTSHKHVLNSLGKAKDPRQAAFIFSRHYEIPAAKYAQNGKRMNYAEQFLNMINPIGTANASETPGQPIDEAKYLDTAKKLGFMDNQQQPSQPVDEAKYLETAKKLGFIKPGQNTLQQIGQQAMNLGGGLAKSVSNVGNTLLSAGDAYNEMLGNKYALSNLDSTGEERRKFVDKKMENAGIDTNSWMYKGGELGGDVALGTGAINRAAKVAEAIPALSKLAVPIRSSGLEGGEGMGALGKLATRTLGGGISGAVSTAAVNPEDALAGGAIGAVLPGGSVLASKAGNAIGKGLSKLASGGGVIPQATKEAAGKAISQGYAIPPSQVKPTLANRLIEGTAGKITTAQNASARNQNVSNALAAKAIGANDLSEGSIAAVRKSANAHYDAVAKVGKLESDDTFRAAIDQASARTAKFAEDFPGLKNREVDDLVESLKSKGSFNSDTAIEAIKRLREDASANKISLDAAKKELGRVQGKIAGSLEDLVDRNLTKMGKQELLGNYRAARQTLAKTYSVEKAVDKATGNLNANKLASELQKGKPLSGELRDIAEFAQAFPKAAQNIAKMGSLPGTSPLDVNGVGLLSGLTGNPGFLALMALRPAARKAALSKFVQKGLVKKSVVKKSGGALARLAKAGARAAPVLLSGQK